MFHVQLEISIPKTITKKRSNNHACMHAKPRNQKKRPTRHCKKQKCIP